MFAELTDFMRKKLDSVDLSERAFERELKYKRGALHNVFLGRAPPRLQDLGRMAKVLKLNAGDSLRLRELALRAHEYNDLADELIALHQRQDKMEKRIAQLEKLVAESGR